MSDSWPAAPQQPLQVQPVEETNLDEHYRRIGISAVAAAARYAGPLRNPDHAPVKPALTPTMEEIMLLG